MGREFVWFLNVLVVATCGLVYELLAGTAASYLLGDSVTQFSLVIGLYLSALGAGAWLSKYLVRDVARRFVDVELAVALLGGFSAPLLFLAFPWVAHFRLLLWSVVFLIGLLVGLELPLLMRILKDRLEFTELVSKVLAFDYLGALVASILFPLVLVPHLGLVRTSLLAGLLNACVALWATHLLRHAIPGHVRGLRVRAGVAIALLLAGLFGAKQLTRISEEQCYDGEILYARDSPYQRIAVVRAPGGFRLYLNGHLQFDSRDEYRYHEALAHPPLLLHGAPRRVLILGGGDGLALREVLRHAGVREVTLVDLDPAMTALSDQFPPLAELNARAFADSRVRVVNADAMTWLPDGEDLYDAAIVDFPDPGNYSVGKLFTRHFYQRLKRRLAPDAGVSVQCTSPLMARRSYWCILRTLEAAGFYVRAYHAAVPSFGDWGFALARPGGPFDPPARVDLPLRFLDDSTLAGLFILPPDIGPVPVEINRLDDQILVRYYDEEWGRWE